MCANYTPVTQREIVKLHFAAGGEFEPLPGEAWPGSVALMIRATMTPSQDAPFEAVAGRFGLLPSWTKDAGFGKRTYNARSETMAEKPSFRTSWRQDHRCIIPAHAIFEPSYESGHAQRWKITQADGRPMGIAGLWSSWRTPTGDWWNTFTMLTINADQHDLMKRFHRPEDEKRMVVVLPQELYQPWLVADKAQALEMLQPYPVSLLVAEPAPIERIRRKPVINKSPDADDLFA